VILRLNPLFNLLTQAIPDTAAVEVVGVVTQFVGQTLVVFGAMRSTFQGLISNMQTERRITMRGLLKISSNFRILFSLNGKH
jgi:alpha-galactosidase/6-phospho-beta-glucosidase family protein